jgi:hypothetical protein
VLEQKNRTLVEVSHNMLVMAKLPHTLWVEVIATTSFVQNVRSL